MFLRQAHYFNVNKKFFPVFFTEGASDYIFRHIAEAVMAESKSTAMKLLCSACEKTSRQCRLCEYQNSTLSVQEANTLQRMSENIFESQEDGKTVLTVRYLFKQPAEVLYHPRLSNKKAALANSMKLWAKLKRNNQLEVIQKLIEDELSRGFLEILSEEQLRESETMPTFYSSINIALNHKKQKYRFVANHSFSAHASGSINEQSLIPPNLLNNPCTILYHFYTHKYCFTSDISFAYKNLRCCPVSNNLRLFLWVKHFNPKQETVSETDFCVFRPKRLSFGSSAAGAYLDLARTNFICKQAKLPESHWIIKNLIFVDDMVGIGRDSKHLEEVRKDVFQAFEHYQFGIKEYFMSDRQGEPVVTSFLGNYWRVGMRGKIDQVKPKLYFSIHERSRNKVPPVLNKENLKTLVVTRRVASRVIGTLFSYLAHDIAPIVCNAKLLYSRICKISKSWIQPIRDIDPGLDRDYMQFLSTLTNLDEDLLYFDRCMIPDDHRLVRIFIPMDASVEMMATMLFLITQHKSSGEIKSRCLTSRTKLTRMTVIKNEAACFKISVSLLSSLLAGLDLSQYEFDIYFFSDSMAATSYFSFTHNHNCIITRNTVELTTKFMLDAIKQYRNIRSINLTWTPGSRNCADLLTRYNKDCIEVTNSEYFKYGPTFFRDPSYPERKYIFMYIKQGSSDLQYIPLKAHELERDSLKKKKSVPDGHTDKVTPRAPGGAKEAAAVHFVKPGRQCQDELSNYQPENCLRVTTINCCQPCTVPWFKAAGYTYKCSEASGPDIKQMPQMNDEFYGSIVSRYSSLRKLINVLYFVFSFMKRKVTKSNIWLRLLYTSQKLYMNASDLKRIKYEYITLETGVVCVKTRKAVCSNQNFVDNFLLPYLPRNDTGLVKLVINYAHVIRIQTPHLSEVHRNIALTKANLQSNIFACWIPKSGYLIAKQIRNCLKCNKITPKFHNFPSSHLRFFHEMKLIGLHSFSSYDLLGPIILANNQHDRKSYKFYVIICECLVTKHVTFQTIDNYSADAVRVGLMSIQNRYSHFVYLLSDCGCQLKLNPDDNIFQPGIIIETLPASSQQLSVVESNWKHIRKLLMGIFNCKERLQYPRLTLLQFQCCLDIVSNVHNSRCIAAGQGPDLQMFISPLLLSKTHLGQAEADKDVKTLLMRLQDENSSYFDLIAENRHFKSFLVGQLKQLLISNNQNFLKKQPDFKFHPGDFCLIKRGVDQLKLCEVVSINESNTYAQVRILHHGKPEVKPAVTSILAFLHRSSDAEDVTDGQTESQET